jgi:hypothetical protein
LPEIAKGYWSTIRIFWSALEIEVFPDHVEIYRFRDRQTDIQHYSHTPGEPFSLELMEALSRLQN